MKTRPHRGKTIPIKKGGANIQLCAQEKSLLKIVVEEKIRGLQFILKSEKNHILARDLNYYLKIYTKLTNKKACPKCGQWI